MGISMDDDQTIYVADCGNDRIVEWKCNSAEGRIVAGKYGRRDQMNQLNRPTDMIIDQATNFLIIAGRGNRPLMRWSRQNNTAGEVIIANIDYSHLTMDKNRSQYVSDWKKNEVRRWKRGDTGEGTIVAGGNGPGDSLSELFCPEGVLVNQLGHVYVADLENDRVTRWCQGAEEGTIVVGGNGRGQQSNQLNNPTGLLFDRQGNLHVADAGNDRIQQFAVK